MIYQYEQNGIKEELWFYVNEQKNEILFVPNDDMIQGVISYPDGTYKIFGTDENGKKISPQLPVFDSLHLYRSDGKGFLILLYHSFCTN